MSTHPLVGEASWIWRDNGGRAFHDVVCFRKTFDLPGTPGASATPSARLRITADSRYIVHLNGRRIGHGPPRAWPAMWTVDEYELAGAGLRAGRNVLAVQVEHFGVGNFQYLHDEPGLLASLTWDTAGDAAAVVTDDTWRWHANEAYAFPVPRIAPQLGWEEQFDARNVPGGAGADWTGVEFDDSAWRRCRVLRAAGEPPHEGLELRDIAHLTYRPVDARRVVAIDPVRPAPYTWNVNVRQFFHPDDRTANVATPSLLLATHIVSPVRQKVQVHYIPGYLGAGQFKLNGKLLAFDDRSLQHTDWGVAHAVLRPGRNLLLYHMPQRTHNLAIALNLWTEQPITFHAMPQDEDGAAGRSATPWLMLGPFALPSEAGATFAQEIPPADNLVRAPSVHPEATAQRKEAIWKAGRLGADDYAAALARVVPPDHVATADVLAISASERVVPDARVTIDAPSALLHDTPDWTTIHPVEGGADVRLLLDFGDEIIGFQALEIDAPAGTIVDGHGFEFIQRDGRINLNEGVNNTFRYVCRDGVQRYETSAHRGLRYLWLSLRGFGRPVRLRHVGTMAMTYPQARHGGFECSDKLLEQIWTVGARSVECCSEDTYTDCPTYEQCHWVGDARNEALVDLVVNGDPRLSRHCWIQTARSLDRSPITESQVPSAWQNLLPAWSFLWMRWAEEHHRLTGDAAFAREAIEFLDRNVEGIEAHVNELGLFQIVAWNMFDWAPMDTPADGTVTHNNCLAVLALRQASALAGRAGRRDRARRWTKLADGLAAAVNRHLWDPRRQSYIDCIHADGSPSKVLSVQTHTVAYLSGVARGARARRCRAIMEKPPRGFVTTGSPFFMFFLLEALAGERRWQELIDTMRSYWGAQVDVGATTFWEMYHPEAERKTRSHCHGWSAAPVYFLSSYVLGIQPAAPGFDRVLVAPRIGDLRWARGRMPTPHGTIETDWTREGKRFELRVSLPKKLPVEIELPVRGTARILRGKAKKIGPNRWQSTSRRLELRVG